MVDGAIKERSIKEMENGKRRAEKRNAEQSMYGLVEMERRKRIAEDEGP